MTISAAELKANLGKYLRLAAKEDIYISQYGKVVAKLSSPFQARLETAESLFGSIPATMTLDEAREGLDCIVTRNVRDYANAPVKVMDPEAFLEMLKA